MSISPNSSTREILNERAPRQATLNVSETAAIEFLKTLDVIGKDGGIDAAALKKLSSDQIKSLQEKMNTAGFNTGEADGIPGKNTLHGLTQALAKNNAVTLLNAQDTLGRDDVRTLQQSLTRLGHDSGKPDGVAGPNTARGIVSFLKDNGADIESVNPSLRAILPTKGVSQKVISLGDASNQDIYRVLGASEHGFDDIKILQQHLKDNGYDVGSVDGNYGPRSQAAFTKYLEEHPEVHHAIGPNLKLETEIYAALNGVSNELRASLKLRDFNELPTKNPDGTVLLSPDLLEAVDKNPVKQQYLDMALAAGRKYGLDPNMLANQAYHESRFNPDAISPPTKYGYSYGIAQMQAGTAALYGVTKEQLYDPVIAFDTMARHVKALTDKLGSQELAMIEYNGGPKATQTLTNVLGKDFTFDEAMAHWDKRKGQGAPNLYHNETRTYAETVVSTQWDMKKLHRALTRPENAKAWGETDAPERAPDTPYRFDGLDAPNHIKGTFTTAAAKPEEAAPKSALGVSFDSAALGVNIGLDKEKPAVDRTLTAQNNNRLSDPSLTA